MLITSVHILKVLSAGIPKGPAAAPVKKLTAAILTGVVGIAFLDWASAWAAPPRGPSVRAVVPAYFRNFLLEILLDMIWSPFWLGMNNHPI